LVLNKRLRHWGFDFENSGFVLKLLGQVAAILTQHTIFNDVAIVREFSHPCCFMRTVFFTELVFYALEFYGGHRLLEVLLGIVIDLLKTLFYDVIWSYPNPVRC